MFDLNGLALKNSKALAAVMRKHLSIQLVHDETTLTIITEFAGHVVNRSKLDMEPMIQAVMSDYGVKKRRK